MLKSHKNALQVTSFEEVNVFIIIFMVNLNTWQPEADAPGHYNEVTGVQILPLEMKQVSVSEVLPRPSY